MLLTITDPDTGKSWPVRAISIKDPNWTDEYVSNMVLFGSCYLYTEGPAPAESYSILDALNGSTE